MAGAIAWNWPFQLRSLWVRGHPSEMPTDAARLNRPRPTTTSRRRGEPVTDELVRRDHSSDHPWAATPAAIRGVRSAPGLLTPGERHVAATDQPHPGAAGWVALGVGQGIGAIVGVIAGLAWPTIGGNAVAQAAGAGSARHLRQQRLLAPAGPRGAAPLLDVGCLLLVEDYRTATTLFMVGTALNAMTASWYYSGLGSPAGSSSTREWCDSPATRYQRPRLRSEPPWPPTAPSRCWQDSCPWR